MLLTLVLAVRVQCGSMADFYFGSLEGGYGGRGGRGGKRSGTVSKSKSNKGTVSKAAKTPFYKPATKNPNPSGFRKGMATVLERGADVAQVVGKALPYVQEGAQIGSSVVSSFRGSRAPATQMVMAPDGQMMVMRRRKKKSKGLSGSDLKGYMRTVKLAKMLVHTPRYMKKSIGKARRRSSLSFR